MLIFRTIIHDRILEARRDALGRERVLVDGVEVSYKPFNKFFSDPHFFKLTGKDGTVRHVEARLEARQWSISQFRAFILVDGVERARLEPLDTTKPLGICTNCGYNLSGLPIDNNELRCPECGRHSLAHK